MNFVVSIRLTTKGVDSFQEAGYAIYTFVHEAVNPDMNAPKRQISTIVISIILVNVLALIIGGL